MIKKVIRILLIVVLIYIAGFLLFSLPVTYWEPKEEAIKYFREHVVDPIPQTIYDIKYGRQTTGIINYYQGITQRRSPVLYFKYRDNLEDYQFLTDWKIDSFGLYKPNALKTATKKYIKPHFGLYVDSDARQAIVVLYAD